MQQIEYIALGIGTARQDRPSDVSDKLYLGQAVWGLVQNCVRSKTALVMMLGLSGQDSPSLSLQLLPLQNVKSCYVC